MHTAEEVMSIRQRIDDATYLWDSGRREGAFLSALIAVAAMSRRKYPQKGDREAFEQFLKDGCAARVSVEFRGELHPVEHIFYKWLRCELVHDAGIPIDIQFMADDGPGLSLRAGGAPEYVLKLSYGWFHHLLNTAANAVENRGVLG